MFEKATRNKLRFNYKGLCSVEDLWDLPLTALDKIYRDLKSELKEQHEDSLLNEKSKKTDTLNLKVDIIRHIVETRLQEEKEKEDQAARAAKKQKILSIIAEKEDKELYEKPKEELEKLLNDL